MLTEKLSLPLCLALPLAQPDFFAAAVRVGVAKVDPNTLPPAKIAAVHEALRQLKREQPPHGASPIYLVESDCTIFLEVNGAFVTAAGTSTSMTVTHRGRNSDGSLVPQGRELLTIRAPGRHAIGVPPGELQFHASGPAGSGWRIELSMSIPPKREKPGTTEQRLAALEAASIPAAGAIAPLSIN